MLAVYWHFKFPANLLQLLKQNFSILKSFQLFYFHDTHSEPKDSFPKIRFAFSIFHGGDPYRRMLSRRIKSCAATKLRVPVGNRKGRGRRIFMTRVYGLRRPSFLSEITKQVECAVTSGKTRVKRPRDWEILDLNWRSFEIWLNYRLEGKAQGW